MPPSSTSPPARALRALRLLAALAVATWMSAACGADAAPAARRPNVLLIVLDTTRADRCGLGGYPRPTTLGLDAFAADAVTFTRSWSPSSWTPPAHASLFTGLRPENHGLLLGVRDFLSDEAHVVAEGLRDAGYATGAFVNNAVVNESSGLLQGFGTVELLFEQRDRVYPFAAPTHARLLEWIDRRRAGGGPFFAFVNHMEPHGPYTPPAPQRQRFRAGPVPPRDLARAASFYGLETLGVNLGILPLDTEFRSLLSDLYDAELATLDAELAYLFEELAARGVLDDTLVVVTADHGENLGDHGLVDHMFSLHRSLLHVPLVVRLPGTFDGGRRVDDLVRSEDVPATIYDVCGVRPRGPLDGTTLRGDLAGRLARARLGRPTSLLEMARGRYAHDVVARFDRSQESVHDGRWHLIRTSDGGRWLYDVDADPGEERDVAAEHPDEVRRLEALLAR